MVPEEILIVNDGSLLLKMMAGLLENRGYQLSVTDSPEEGLALLSSRNIILAVVKLNGQQTDRLALMHMVKELNGGTRLMIVGDQAHLPPEIFEIEADDYVMLPCRMAEVWRRLTLCLETPAVQPEIIREDPLMHPVNQRVLHNLGLMFHDMRGLLTSISEGMKLLNRRLDGSCSREVDRIFSTTFQKTQTLLGMSEEYLGNILRRTQDSPYRDRVDLREDVVEPVMEEFGKELQEHSITLDNRLSQLPPADQSIRGDRAALKSVFRNLLHNAITHGGSGCTISIDVAEHPGFFRLQVQNSGAPIPPKRRQEVFTRGKTAPGNGNGMGLGLHLGREVLRSQGGDISYELCREGSNFVMTLPRA